MADKEATARIKINKLLETAGWRFFPDGHHPANVSYGWLCGGENTPIKFIGV